MNKLFFPRWRVSTRQRKPSRSIVLRLFVHSFDLICESMSNFNCILCFKEIIKDYERFLVQSKKKNTVFAANKALASLDFVVYTLSEYICRQCSALLKKRENLKQNLKDMEKSLQDGYAENLTKTGLIFKTKEPVNSSPPKRLRLEQDSGGGVYPEPSLSASPIPLCTSTPKKRAESDKLSTTSVKVHIEWPSNRMERKVPEQLESLGKMLIRGTYKQIANAAWRSPLLKKELQLIALKEIDKECSAMCSKKEPSCVRSPDQEKLLNFTFDKFNDELASKAPFFHAVLRVSCVNSRRIKNSVWKQAVGMAAAICLRNWSQFMNGVQLLISIFGYHSNWMVRLMF